MQNYLILAVLLAICMSGFSDVSRIQRLEAQNRELISRLELLERYTPPSRRSRERADAEALAADGDGQTT
ncbi:MAG: hypothetical protein ACO1RX_22230 [Candidatus Sericytochromatia bacterium]